MAGGSQQTIRNVIRAGKGGGYGFRLSPPERKVSGRNRTDDRTPTRYGDFGVTACCQDKRSTSTFTGAI